MIWLIHTERQSILYLTIFKCRVTKTGNEYIEGWCTKFFEGLTFLRLWQINFKGGWHQQNHDPNGTVASLWTSDNWKTLSAIDKSVQQLLLLISMKTALCWVI